MPHKNEYKYLKEQFYSPDTKFKPSVFFDAKQTDAASDAVNFVRSCECRDIGCIIPRISEDRRLDRGELEHFRETYSVMLETAKQKGIEIVFNLEGAIEDAVIEAEEEVYNESFMRSKVLVRREYCCSPEESVSLRLHDGILMSLVAINAGFAEEVLDIRSFVGEDGILRWKAPRGNWTVVQYLCIDDDERNFANVLNYDASMKYLQTAYSLFSDIFDSYVPETLTAVAYSNVCFASRNRRDWDPSFNEYFKQLHGFDPAPLYPALFSFSVKDANKSKAIMFDCRARMLVSGMMKALKDFADLHGLRLVGTISEPKLSACSFINGDAILDSMFAPGALYDKAYMYGTNSVKIAAAASYNFGQERVFCELFRDYYKISKKIMYNDALNAYARGANLIAAHMPVISEDHAAVPVPFVKSETAPDWQEQFACFTSRTQALLRGGTHICDIGVLYPIYTIHSGVNFYVDNTQAFEYPDTPENIDYMTLINSITMFSGHDLTIIHPDAIQRSCRVENACLYLDNGKRVECLRLMIMPCCEIVSVYTMRRLLEFYKSGGHLIATGSLPKYAFEPDENGENDREVQRICEEIFGSDAVNSGIIRAFCQNSNDKGGEAVFLYFTKTAADGTNMTSSHKVNRAICSFDIPYDMYLPDMPRLECTGSLNNPYLEFVRLGLINSIPGGGMLNHIHKPHGATDVYYFSNTTDRNYDKFVLLRGAMSPEIWDPHTIKVTRPECKYVRWHGEIYTRVELPIEHARSVFVISDKDTNPPVLPDFIPELTHIEGIAQ